MFGLGIQELWIIVAIVFIIFGINKLPKIGKDLGVGIRELRKAAKELRSEDEDEEEK